MLSGREGEQPPTPEPVHGPPEPGVGLAGEAQDVARSPSRPHWHDNMWLLRVTAATTLPECPKLACPRRRGQHFASTGKVPGPVPAPWLCKLLPSSWGSQRTVPVPKAAVLTQSGARVQTAVSPGACGGQILGPAQPRLRVTACAAGAPVPEARPVLRSTALSHHLLGRWPLATGDGEPEGVRGRPSPRWETGVWCPSCRSLRSSGQPGAEALPTQDQNAAPTSGSDTHRRGRRREGTGTGQRRPSRACRGRSTRPAALA